MINSIHIMILDPVGDEVTLDVADLYDQEVHFYVYLIPRLSFISSTHRLSNLVPRNTEFHGISRPA